MYQGALVLIKKILRKNKSITEFRKDYEEEIKLIYEAARTRRKSEISNIVYVEPISLISSDNNHAYIIMEYCRGGSLSSLMAQR
jgi:serine/threonine protein kinase